MLNLNSQTFKSGIARKLTIYTVLFSSLITLLITAMQLYRTYDEDIALIQSSLKDIEQIHLKSLISDLWATDSEQLQTHLEGVSNIRDIQFLEVRDHEKIWVSIGSKTSEKAIMRQYPMIYTHRGKPLEIGTLTIVASLSGVYQRLIEQTGIVLIHNGIKTFLVTGFILMMFHLMITQHLIKISDFARALHIDQLDRPFNLSRKTDENHKTDELDLVVSAIQQMQLNLKKSFKALEDSDQRFQTLAKVAPVGIFQTDATGNCTYVNERWIELADYQSPKEAYGDGWVHALHPEDRKHVFNAWYQAAINNTPFKLECRFQRPDGSVSWILASAEAEINKHGEVTGYVGAVTDISQQKETEAVVHHIATGVSAKTGDAFFKSLVIHLCKLFKADHVLIGLFENAKTQSIQTVALCERGEIKENIQYALAGTPCEETLQRTSCYYVEKVQEHFPQDHYLQEVGAEGYIGVPLFYTNGNPMGIIVVVSCSPMEKVSQQTDILEIFAIRTSAEIERLHTEKNFNESQQRLLLHREQAPLGIIEWTADFKVVDWNPAAETIFGYAQEEVIGKHGLDLLIPESRRKKVMAAWQHFIKHKTYEQHEGENRTKSGELRICEWYNTPLVNTKGEVIGITTLVKDITEQQRIEQTLQRSLKMKAIGQLAGGIAHDFNNQLGIIIGYLDLLSHHFSKEEQSSQWLKIATNATLHCSDLTQQLLSFSRRQRKGTRFVDLNASITHINAMIAHSLTPAIQVNYALTDALWPTMLDLAEFQDALLNLIINARDAMPGGGTLLIETSNIFLDQQYCTFNPGLFPGDYVQLKVSDTGIGMSKEVLARTSEPFFSTKPEGEGTGLGLTMVFGFVKRYRGYIKIVSEPLIGTTVLMYFPRQFEKSPTNTIEDTLQISMPAGHESILVVDDEADQLTLAHLYLSKLGYQVSLAENGPEALNILREDESIDLLFSDIVMPGGIDGDELAQEALKLHPKLKVLLTSGLNQNPLKKREHPGHSSDVLYKPYRKDELAQRIRNLLDEKEHVNT